MTARRFPGSLAAAVLAACLAAPAPARADAVSALAEIRSHRMVEHVRWARADRLWVFVRAEARDYDRVAAAFCRTLVRNGVREVSVSIMTHGRVPGAAGVRRIGHADCVDE